MFDGKTALLLGGVSPEREVSLTSGQAVGDALRRIVVKCWNLIPLRGLGGRCRNRASKECLIFYTAAPVKMAKCKVP